MLVPGLFSRKPNNLFEGNYPELRGDILEKLYDQHAGDEADFAVLLLPLKESRDALSLCQSTEEYAPLFRRFYIDDKPRYRVYFAITALCDRVPCLQTNAGCFGRADVPAGPNAPPL